MAPWVCQITFAYTFSRLHNVFTFIKSKIDEISNALTDKDLKGNRKITKKYIFL